MSEKITPHERAAIDAALLGGNVTKLPPAPASAPDVLDGDFLFEVRVKNGRIAAAMRRAGIATIAELSRQTGIYQTNLGKLVNLKVLPIKKAPGINWIKDVERLAKFFGVSEDDLFPPSVKHSALKTNKFFVAASEAEISIMLESMEANALPPDEIILRVERRQILKRLLNNLPARTCRILDQRLDGKLYKEIGAVEKISVEKVRQIERRALRDIAKGKRSIFRREHARQAKEGVA